MLQVIRILCFAALAVPGAFAQADSPDVLSAEDWELVRLVLESSLNERAAWSADSAVLLDSTRPTCDGSDRRQCFSPTVLDDLTLPSATSLMPECGRLDYRALRKAFVDRNARRWRVSALQTGLAIVSGSEVRAMSTEALLDRFPGRRFVEVNAPGYSPDGQFALVYVRGFLALEGGWARIQVFERQETRWTPIRCGLTITA